MHSLLLFITSGIPGFVSYLYLSKLQLLYFNEKEEKEDKLIVLSILSLLNILVSTLFFNLIARKSIEDLLNIYSYSWREILLFIGITILYCFLATKWVYPKLMVRLTKHIEQEVDRNNVTRTSSAPLTLQLFKSSKFDKTYLYIFDFNDKLIDSGYWSEFDTGENDLLGLGRPTVYGDEQNSPTINEVTVTYNSMEDDEARMIIDLKHQVKIFLFYTNESTI